MSVEHFYSSPASLSLEPYKNAPYYILTKEGVARADTRLTGAVASRGDIFQYDPDSDGTLHEINKSDKKKTSRSRETMRSIHSKKVKVEWDSTLFAPLTNEEKELLEAIESTKCRFMTYSDPKEFLSFGCQLKKGDMVQVCSSALSKSKDDVHGMLMHKGPLVPSRGFEAKGTWFGVILSTRCGKTSGRYKGYTYFDCDDEFAVFVSIDKLVPVPIPRKAEGSHRQAKDVSSRNCTSARLGIDGAPAFIKKGSKVEVRTFLRTGKQWIEGKVVDTKSKDGETYVAVEVAKHHALIINTHGMYRGKDIFSSNMSAYIVTAQISDVRLLESTQRDQDEFRNSTAALKNMPQTNVWERSKDGMTASSVNANCRDQMQKNVQETSNIHGTCWVTASQPYSLGSLSTRSDVSMSHPRVSSSPPVEMLGKSDREVTRSDSFDDSAKSSAAGRTSKSQESKGNKFTFYNMMSNMPSLQGFSRADSTRGIPEEEIANTKEIAWEEEQQKKLMREVTDLQGQLQIMKTKYSDTVKRLEEESQKMNSFELKNAELELELHQTKHDQASYQEEVERLKKELEGYKKQKRLENETGKLREMEAKLEEERKQKKLEGDLEDLATSVKNANKAKEDSVRQQQRVQQITDKLMAEHGISRAAVDTVFSLREEHELSECIEAMKAVGSNLQRAWDYFKECDTCFTKLGMHKIHRCERRLARTST